jgi:hypothetical protein
MWLAVKDFEPYYPEEASKKALAVAWCDKVKNDYKLVKIIRE